MAYGKYYSFDELYNAISDSQRMIIDQLRVIFLGYTGVTESVKRDCLHFRFPNGMRCYINPGLNGCMSRNTQLILGVSRGAWMVKQEPWIAGIFDEVKIVVGKIYIKDVDTIKEKAIHALVEKIYNLPKGIGVK